MKLYVISDTHIAEVWDKIDKEIPSRYHLLDPNKNLERAISKLDKDSFLVCNGDLIDYYYSSYLGKGKSNWRLFFKLIKSYRGEVLLNYGNHDYRKLAYDFGIYGLRQIGLSNKIRQKYELKIGYDKFRFLQELDSIKVDEHKFNTLSHCPHKSVIEKKFKNYNILLLNTGPDAFTRKDLLFNPRYWKPMFSAHPSSRGLTQKQIRKLKQYLQGDLKKETFVFLHSPPLSSKIKIKQIKLNKQKYWSILRKNKLIDGTFILNNQEFIETLLKSPQNLTVITSHVNFEKQYLLDKETRNLRQSNMKEINHLRFNKRYIKFISTLPLGEIEHRRNTGYLQISDKLINYVKI